MQSAKSLPRLSVVVFLLGLSTNMVGCQQQSRPGEPSSEEATTASDTDAASAEPSRPALPTDAPAVADDPPEEVRTAATVAVHPIDQTPHGAPYRAAVAAVDRGDIEVAEQQRQKLANHPQYAVLADAIGGFMLAKAGKAEQAIAVAEAISRVPVMRAEAYLIAGQAFHSQGRWGEAIEAFRGALQYHDSSTRAHRWLGALLYDTGAMWDAVEHLRRVARLDPDDVRALRLAGLIHYDYQQYDEAVADYRDALARQIDSDLELAVRLELADSLRELRRYDEALDALAMAPELPEVLSTRAACHESAGDDAQALQAAQRALELESGQRLANLVVGRIELAQRHLDAAIEHLRLAVDADPADHEPRFLLGRALLQSGHTEQGQAEVQRSTELKEMTLELAELHLQAIAEPEDVELRLRMGQLAEKIGRRSAARDWYRAALGLDPTNQQAAEALQRLSDAGPDTTNDRP